ncbi:MAG: 50S ribosomal protein L10 [Clostridiales bacterium]|nr:50S ribosomal protein L10 [Clostridiales bacterium]MCD7827486.1 50S ribosomal protein L10 [Clostridiales bacterium]
MPSAKILEQKKQQVAVLSEKINKSVAGVIVDYKGINVADDTVLRADLRKAGVDYAVVKNTLLTLALKGTGLEELTGILEGTTALAVSETDCVASAKILSQFADKHENFSIKGGFLEGEVISLEKIDSLAKLPSREVLLATVAAAFQAPMASFARAVKAVAEKDGETTEDAPAEAAADAAPAAEEAAPTAE